MAAEYKKFPTDLEPKGDKTVTFVHSDYPDDESQNIEVLSSISAEDLARLEKLGYKRKPGAKARGPEDEDEAPKKTSGRGKAAAASE